MLQKLLILFGSLCNAEDFGGSMPGILPLHHSGFKPGFIPSGESPQLFGRDHFTWSPAQFNFVQDSWHCHCNAPVLHLVWNPPAFPF